MSNLDKMILWAFLGMVATFFLGAVANAKFNFIKAKNPL